MAFVNEVIRLYLLSINKILGGSIRLGTATTDLVGFYDAAPTDQGAAIADAAGGATVDAEARTAINAALARLRELGLIAT